MSDAVEEFRRYLDECVEAGTVTGPAAVRIRDRIEGFAALVARLQAAEADNTRLRAENKRLADDVQEWYAAHRSRLTR